MRRTQLDTSVLKTENSVSNPSGIPFPDGLETELSVSNFDFSCSVKQASRSWNTRFYQAIKSYGFDQCPDESCVYKKFDGSVVVFLVLYVDDILLIGNDVGILSSVKVWLSSQFDMKDLGEACHILGIKLLWDRKQIMLGLSQATYIDQILARFSL